MATPKAINKDDTASAIRNELTRTIEKCFNAPNYLHGPGNGAENSNIVDALLKLAEVIEDAPHTDNEEAAGLIASALSDSLIHSRGTITDAVIAIAEQLARIADAMHSRNDLIRKQMGED